MKKSLITLSLLLSMITLNNCSNTGESVPASEIIPGIPVKNTVTMVDLGAKTCVPCKLMAPILEKLKKEYTGRAEIIFIDVWDQANKGKAQKFRASIIPTQIFYDRYGKEVFRHVGFFGREDIIEKLEELLT